MEQNSDSLNHVVRWWASRDDLGGFRTVGSLLFDLWKPAKYCRTPGRPGDPEDSFGIHKNADGLWFFKDYIHGYSGGLVEFVMRKGWSKSDAFLWLAEIAARDGSENSPVGPNFWVPAPRERHIHFFNPHELRTCEPDHGVSLIGDSHIARGEVFLIGGEAGVGKSRAATSLAIAGAMGGSCGSWFGLPVHRQFRTLIIQTENSRHRLRQEYAAYDTEPLIPWIRISEPPPFGLNLSRQDGGEFQFDFRAAIAEFKPDCVILDPWNAAARDDKQRHYSPAFDSLRNILPTGADRPALGIVAHTRKPRSNEKHTGGTALMHLLAGSYILSSVPRSVFILTRATDSETDPRVLCFNPKNNNGDLVPRTAWTRTPTGFHPIPGFDWEDFENTTASKTVALEHLQKLFADGKSLKLSEAVARLTLIAAVSRPAAYGILSDKGRFARHLVRKGKLIALKAKP